VPVVGLVLTLVAGEDDLVGVDDDDVVAAVDMRGVAGEMLAAEAAGEDRREAAAWRNRSS
jgi:hypothetical protein